MAKVYSLMSWNVEHFKKTLTLDNLPSNYLFIGDLKPGDGLLV